MTAALRTAATRIWLNILRAFAISKLTTDEAMYHFLSGYHGRNPVQGIFHMVQPGKHCG
jgi:hypothetical protein